MRGALVTAALLLVLRPAGADFYADLGVSRRASADEIRAAYKSLAKKHHPDKSGAPDANDRFAQLATAYETLSDPETRRQYDNFGPEYASRAGARGGAAGYGQARDPFAEFFAQSARGGFGFGGGGFGGGARPSFSATVELDADNWDALVGARQAGETKLWLVCFYADSSSLSRAFGAEWEALALRLSPMVRLGRVNTESRNTWPIVRRFRTLISRVPSVVMVGDDGGDTSRATAYYGSRLGVDALAEWARRFLPVAQVVRLGSARALAEFVGRHAREAGGALPSAPEPRTPVLILSRNPSHDSLLLRYLSHRTVGGSEDGGVQAGNGGARVVLAHAHVPAQGGGSSAGAQLASALGARSVPAVAIWRDGPDMPPEVYSLAGPAAQSAGAARRAAAADADAAAAGLGEEAAQRARLIRLVRARGSPRLCTLRASNAHDVCVRPAREAEADGRAGGCALVLCGASARACAGAAALAAQAEALLRERAGEAEPRARWALVDATRQQPLARALLAGAGAGGADAEGDGERAQAGAALSDDALPAIALVLPATDRRGLGHARFAVYGGKLASAAGSASNAEPEAAARALADWVDAVLSGGGGRTGRRAELPPLLADRPPGAGAHVWSALFGSSLALSTKLYLLGAMGLAALLGGGLLLLGSAGRARPKKRAAPQGAGARANGAGAGDDVRGAGGDRSAAAPGEPGASTPPPGGAGPERPAGGAERGGADVPFDAPALQPASLAAALSAAPFCVVVPYGSAVYASSGCSATVRVLRSRYAAEGSFHFATLGLHEDDGGNLLFRRLQLVLRQCGCVALRRTSDIERTRVAVYSGPMSPDALSSWLDRLVGGEIPLAYLMM